MIFFCILDLLSFTVVYSFQEFCQKQRAYKDKTSVTNEKRYKREGWGNNLLTGVNQQVTTKQN